MEAVFFFVSYFYVIHPFVRLVFWRNTVFNFSLWFMFILLSLCFGATSCVSLPVLVFTLSQPHQLLLLLTPAPHDESPRCCHLSLTLCNHFWSPLQPARRLSPLSCTPCVFINYCCHISSFCSLFKKLVLFYSSPSCLPASESNPTTDHDISFYFIFMNHFLLQYNCEKILTYKLTKRFVNHEK